MLSTHSVDDQPGHFWRKEERIVTASPDHDHVTESQGRRVDAHDDRVGRRDDGSMGHAAQVRVVADAFEKTTTLVKVGANE
jgi:hypothetical protein